MSVVTIWLLCGVIGLALELILPGLDQCLILEVIDPARTYRAVFRMWRVAYGHSRLDFPFATN